VLSKLIDNSRIVHGNERSMILIEKVAGGYTATSAPPHTRDVFRSRVPSSREDLIAALRQRGAAPSDIGAAFDIADQEWAILNGEDDDA
jgi:hypothetical protein